MSWPPLDHAVVDEVLADDAERCHRCGSVPDDWQDEHGHPLDDPSFRAETIRCFGCRELDEAMKAVPKGRAGYGVFARLGRALRR